MFMKCSVSDPHDFGAARVGIAFNGAAVQGPNPCKDPKMSTTCKCFIDYRTATKRRVRSVRPAPWLDSKGGGHMVRYALDLPDPRSARIARGEGRVSANDDRALSHYVSMAVICRHERSIRNIPRRRLDAAAGGPIAPPPRPRPDGGAKRGDIWRRQPQRGAFQTPSARPAILQTKSIHTQSLGEAGQAMLVGCATSGISDGAAAGDGLGAAARR